MDGWVMVVVVVVVVAGRRRGPSSSAAREWFQDVSGAFLQKAYLYLYVGDIKTTVTDQL